MFVRVLHIVPARPFGGAQKVVAQLAGEQRRLEIDARVLTLYTNTIFFRDLELRDVPFHTTGGRFPFDHRALLRLHRYIKSIKPDIISLHMTLLWSQLVLSFTLKKDCPWIYHAHTYPPAKPNYKHNLVKVLLSSQVDAVVGVSESVTRAWQRYLGNNIRIYRVVYNGIDYNAHPSSMKEEWPGFMAGIVAGRPLIGMATRFAEDKGVKEFIDALPSISRHLPEARFVLAGEGPLLPWAREYRAALGLQDKLAFPGFIQETSVFWASLDFALFTSPKEPFGLRIIEPQAAGTAVAGYFNGSGSDEIIVPDETGILVPWDDRDRLAEGIMALWSDPGKYAMMARAARDRLETHFSSLDMAEKVKALYQELLG